MTKVKSLFQNPSHTNNKISKIIYLIRLNKKKSAL